MVIVILKTEKEKEIYKEKIENFYLFFYIS